MNESPLSRAAAPSQSLTLASLQTKRPALYQEAAAATRKLTADSSSFVPVVEPSVVVDKMQSVSFLLCVVPLVVRWLLLLSCVCLCVVIALMMLPPYTLVSGPGEH